MTIEVKFNNVDVVTETNEVETALENVNSKRLEDVISEINTAYEALRTTELKANDMIAHARKIEIGGKKLKKEFMKREKQMKELETEIQVIKDMCEKFGYTLEEGEE